MSSVQASSYAAIYAAQRDYRWVAKVSSPETRREMLCRLRRAVVKNAERVSEALFADLGKPRNESVHSEVRNVLKAIDGAIADLELWMKPVMLGASTEFQNAELRLEYEARGVVLIFGPWNFPFQLLFESLIPTIAAGNTAIVKPNEMCPETSKVSSKVIREAFQEKEVAAVEGGINVANALLDLPIDHVFFTGSPTVGKVVAAAAARHLASVTMELGGKSPVIVDGTTDLRDVAEVVAEGRLHNSGQICLACDHIWLPEKLRDTFLKHYWEIVDRKHYPAGKFDPSTMSRMVDERNAARVQSYIDDAVERGATKIRGGRSSSDPAIFEPAVLLDVPLDARVMQEEIFGPVLPVMTYGHVSEVLEYVQNGNKPLAMYIFSAAQEFIGTILSKTSSGGVTINGWASHWGEQRLPFGGVGNSGSGRYHGAFGFKELSHERAILTHAAICKDDTGTAWSERLIVPSEPYVTARDLLSA